MKVMYAKWTSEYSVNMPTCCVFPLEDLNDVFVLDRSLGDLPRTCFNKWYEYVYQCIKPGQPTSLSEWLPFMYVEVGFQSNRMLLNTWTLHGAHVYLNSTTKIKNV